MTTPTLAGSARQPACHSRADPAVSQLQAEATRHSQLHVAAGRGRVAGNGDPQPAIEREAGSHVTDNHVEHVQVGECRRSSQCSLPERTADRTPTVRRTQNICYAPDLGVAIRLAEPAHNGGYLRVGVNEHESLSVAAR
jgi:hypothetical protein